MSHGWLPPLGMLCTQSSCSLLHSRKGIGVFVVAILLGIWIHALVIEVVRRVQIPFGKLSLAEFYGVAYG